jgi:FkbM family methyltransferase
MYYISKPSTKIMTISDPTPMMEYVINATTSAAADELFVDIGGNIGLYTLSTLSLGIPTLSVEPIAYNLDRLCKGYRKNMEALVKPPPDAAQFTLIKAAVANEAKPEMNISHPVASFGKQDQSSLFANTIGVVRKPVLEVETVPLVRLDQVIPANIPIGFVKIDVQGAESLVLEGMRGLLERKTGFPKMVWYEEQARVVKKANIVKLGQNQAYLESFGYQCRTLVNDILCQKERA